MGIREIRGRYKEALRAKQGGLTAKELRVAAKEKYAQKHANPEKKRYGTRGVNTTKGLEIMFGYSDAKGEFHIMEPADYVREFKALSGTVPIHEKLLEAPGISAKDKAEIRDAIEHKRNFLKKVDAMVNQAEEAVVQNLQPVVTKAKPVKPKTNGGKKK